MDHELFTILPEVEEKYGELIRTKRLSINAAYEILIDFPHQDAVQLNGYILEQQQKLPAPLPGKKVFYFSAAGKMTANSHRLHFKTYRQFLGKYFKLFEFGFLPLAIGINHELAKHPVIMACGVRHMSLFLRFQTCHIAYLSNVIRGRHRYNLDAEPVAALSKKEKKFAKQRLAQIEKKIDDAAKSSTQSPSPQAQRAKAMAMAGTPTKNPRERGASGAGKGEPGRKGHASIVPRARTGASMDFRAAIPA